MAKPRKPVKVPTARRKSSNAKMGVYSNLVYKRRMKADLKARKKAEDLASLPKNPVARFFAHLHPKRVFRYWFCVDGLFRVLKFFAACFLLVVIAIGGLFLYFKKDLDMIRLENMNEMTSTTVNTYLDRNGEVLWQDKGDGDYRLSVEGDKISTYMRQATVALEDRNFYNHMGVDFWGIARAFWMTMTGKQVQGGSTLTQQLIKQVYFSDEASKRDASGIPRKIKETILALEVEKIYDKEQIITMYLNKSPYGGRRNGVESGARTYFGVSAADLTLAQAALLAAIPNNPTMYNPYNTNESSLKRLVDRQHHALNAMVDLGYITREEADEAMAVPILDTILPEADQYKDMKAPHFVIEVKKQLEEKYGVRTMRAGGFTITTTLDWRAQGYAEAAVAHGRSVMDLSKDGDNIAFSAVDVETAQVIALVGSIDWNMPIYGQVNATNSSLEPGSTIKPMLDYAPLFMQRSGQNFGPGSILSDEDINAVYCKGTYGKCSIKNADGRTYGNKTIRWSLANSLNRPAVKALYINGIEDSLDIAHRLGDWSYCEGSAAGLSMGIGGGCGVKQIEHVNAYASFARGGVYKPIAYWLEVKNSAGDIIDRWEDEEGERVVDEQIAYMISDILSELAIRVPIYTSAVYQYGYNIPGVWTAWKTGTTDNGSGRAKDMWLNSYSTVVSASVWVGNHDGSPLVRKDNKPNRWVINDFMENVHKNVYGPDGKWTSGDKPKRPAGIKTMTVNGVTDIWPSWYNEKTSGVEKTTVTFDSITKKMATEYTPSETRIGIVISKMIDPMTKNEIWTASGGGSDGDNDAYLDAYLNEMYDDLHQAGDARPVVSGTVVAGNVSATCYSGTHPLVAYTILVDGVAAKNGTVAHGETISYTISGSYNTVVVMVRDAAGYTTSEEL